MKRYPRDAYTVATKCLAWAAPSAEEAKSNLATSLERMGLDYVDFYLLHNVGGERTAKFDAYGMWDFALDAKERGLIRNVGFSMHDGPDALDALLTAHPQMDRAAAGELPRLGRSGGGGAPLHGGGREARRARGHHGARARRPPGELPQRVADVLRAANPTPAWPRGRTASAATSRTCSPCSGMSNLDQVRQNVADYQATARSRPSRRWTRPSKRCAAWPACRARTAATA